ncbi:hypothetical protein RF11_09459 [Thelohanellus kitauei]|uniref:Uncharacterized protein n=1 Tax=Thelohanellus kitauei TaxID=669202 RepID=A0A0C2ICD9_THEKT|nr:hypothetical protein RF11_09459 [Thelohanellus kitauei]
MIPENQSFGLLDWKEFLISNNFIDITHPKNIIPLKCNLDSIDRHFTYIIENQERITEKLKNCFENISQKSTMFEFSKSEILACTMDIESYNDDYNLDTVHGDYGSFNLENNWEENPILECLISRIQKLYVTKTENTTTQGTISNTKPPEIFSSVTTHEIYLNVTSPEIFPTSKTFGIVSNETLKSENISSDLIKSFKPSNSALIVLGLFSLICLMVIIIHKIKSKKRNEFYYS